MSETLHLEQGGLLAVRELHLDVVEGPDVGETFGPISLPAHVGSASGNDLMLGDSAVSRFHFTIKGSPAGPLLVDNRSTNGTFLGDHRIREAYLVDGDRIRAGTSVLVVRAPGRVRYLELTERTRFGDLLGESAEMRALFRMLERLAPATAGVLIEGETGTGKELVARALHSESPRSAGPFFVVDCGAAAPSLIESELFGHRRGAFTGADSDRKGAFELASGGTLFLDEVGELPLELQPKLLRALENGVIRPLGSSEERSVSVRVVAATHRDLRQMVNEGRFREDLFFRLAVCPVQIPPLRERPGDLKVLARHFLRRAMEASGELDAAQAEPSPQTLEYLSRQELRGNVRELRNLVERAVVLGDPEATRSGDLSPALRAVMHRMHRPEAAELPLDEAKRRFEREYLAALLTRHPGQLAAAAQEAGLHVNSLHRLMTRHGLRKGAASSEQE